MFEVFRILIRVMERKCCIVLFGIFIQPAKISQNEIYVHHAYSSARQNRDSKISITFAKTDPIPTHMLSYAIFDNQGYVENSHGGAYTIWTRGNARNQVSYAFETIAAVVEEMIDFTNVGSPSPVMDFIAMPGDMDGHGDESRWGSLLHA